jgi:hypothetical protein
MLLYLQQTHLKSPSLIGTMSKVDTTVRITDKSYYSFHRFDRYSLFLADTRTRYSEWYRLLTPVPGREGHLISIKHPMVQHCMLHIPTPSHPKPLTRVAHRALYFLFFSPYFPLNFLSISPQHSPVYRSNCNS